MEQIQVDEETRQKLMNWAHECGNISLSGGIMKLVDEFKQLKAAFEVEVTNRKVAQDDRAAAMKHVTILKAKLERRQVNKEAKEKAASGPKRGPGRPKKVVEEDDGQEKSEEPVGV